MNGAGTAIGEHNVLYIGDGMRVGEGAATTLQCCKADPPLVEGAATTTRSSKPDLPLRDLLVDAR